ncbi:hypothetical protein [Neisseria shayeganii]|uniref:Uncharacterized protein n=1 Tax=Neisseria shayeganii 871 TaxID=1032488 RepID=G4CG76_9NEIS|nr:hypothetical protein [Neisseria shayeganii]EGY53124.1 hypothetical protein HMPREF9371_0615 [Neisseria shayeganii 871]
MEDFAKKAVAIDEALTVCCEMTATELSAAAKAAMIEDLLVYETAQVLKALHRCRRELTGRLTLAAVLERIDTGLPSADEAFGMLVEGWRNEALTVVVPVIAMKASENGAMDLFYAGDKTGARMAFRAAYERLAADVQTNGGKVDWFVSKGHDREHQTKAIMEAVQLGRLPQQKAAMYLPSEAGEERYLLETGQVLTEEQRRIGKQVTANLLALLDKRDMANA